MPSILPDVEFVIEWNKYFRWKGAWNTIKWNHVTKIKIKQ